jgi:chemotaxis protein CheX
MQQDNDDIMTIAKMVLSIMLDMEADQGEPQPLDGLKEMISGCVQISGQWQGAVVLQSSAAFATRAAVRMLSIPAGDVTESDLLDVIAELANMIGGNLKGLVPHPSFLSLPCVARGKDFRIPGAATVCEVLLQCGGEPLRVLKCERRVADTPQSSSGG